MRDFVLGLSLAVLAILHQRDALAEQGPRFECPKARTAAERAICDDPFSILMDREIERQFGALRSKTAQSAGSSPCFCIQFARIRRKAEIGRSGRI